jgi:hypothetical protein
MKRLALRRAGSYTSCAVILGILMAVWVVPVQALAASATLTWTAPGDDGDVGTAAQYDLRYSTSPITPANWDSATPVTGEPTPAAAGATESFTVLGLQPNTMYYFAIKTADEVFNWSDLSNVPSITTSDEAAPAAIADLSATIE